MLWEHGNHILKYKPGDLFFPLNKEFLGICWTFLFYSIQKLLGKRMPETNLEPQASERVCLFGQRKRTHSIPPPRKTLFGDTAKNPSCGHGILGLRRGSKNSNKKACSSPAPVPKEALSTLNLPLWKSISTKPPQNRSCWCGGNASGLSGTSGYWHSLRCSHRSPAGRDNDEG